MKNTKTVMITVTKWNFWDIKDNVDAGLVDGQPPTQEGQKNGPRAYINEIEMKLMEDTGFITITLWFIDVPDGTTIRANSPLRTGITAKLISLRDNQKVSDFQVEIPREARFQHLIHLRFKKKGRTPLNTTGWELMRLILNVLNPAGTWPEPDEESKSFKKVKGKLIPNGQYLANRYYPERLAL